MNSYAAIVWCAVIFLCSMASADIAEQDASSQLIQRRSTSLSNLVKALKNLEAKVNQLSSAVKAVPLLRGRDGRDGKPGINGRDGRDGKPAVKGARGPKGNPGSRGWPGARGPRGPRAFVGVKYIRWGKTSCPRGVHLVYKGRVGGEHYSHHGGAAQYVCLPETPRYLRYQNGWQDGGFMYGAEYELSGYNLFRKNNLNEHEVPCAVCYVTSRGSQLMIPATYACPSGWTREYYGYLMTAHYGHQHSSEYICVDIDAEFIPGTSSNLNGALLYPVQGKCGALPCAPYVAGRELTCAVCTK